ncbi:MAG: DUF6732 family protein [Pseudomonadota bacterium]
MRQPLLAGIAAVLTTAGPAAAHPGHIADLAGHGHWISLGALAAAGLLAGWLAGTRGKNDAAGEDEAPQDLDEDAKA